MAEIRAADDIDFARFYRGLQWPGQMVCRALWQRRAVIGFGGAIETAEGEWLSFLEVPSDARKPHIYRHVLQVLNELKKRGARVVKAWCDADIPRAEEMMKRLGFQPTDERINGRVVWVWVL